MNTFRSILLILPLIFLSCNQTDKDTSHQDIYDFMEIVIKKEKLDKNYAMSGTPQDRFNISESDSILFDQLLFKIQQKEQESSDESDVYSFSLDIINKLEGFTKEDILDMKRQKKELTNFKWDNSRLGFNQSNKKRWYAFSVPLFSKDKTKAIMMIEKLCPGLCGEGQTILFTKENNEWKSPMIGFWMH